MAGAESPLEKKSRSGGYGPHSAEAVRLLFSLLFCSYNIIVIIYLIFLNQFIALRTTLYSSLGSSSMVGYVETTIFYLPVGLMVATCLYLFLAFGSRNFLKEFLEDFENLGFPFALSVVINGLSLLFIAKLFSRYREALADFNKKFLVLMGGATPLYEPGDTAFFLVLGTGFIFLYSARRQLVQFKQRLAMDVVEAEEEGKKKADADLRARLLEAEQAVKKSAVTDKKGGPPPKGANREKDSNQGGE